MSLIWIIGLNDQMNSKKPEMLKSDWMKELIMKRCHGIINDRYIDCRKICVANYSGNKIRIRKC